MAKRKYIKVDPDQLKQLHQQRLDVYNELLRLRTKRNEISQAINAGNSSDRKQLIAEGKTVKADTKAHEDRLTAIERDLLHLALQIPNDTHPEAPVGPEENARVIKIVGEQRKSTPDHPLEDHLDIALRLNILDLEQAAIVSGSSFYYLQGLGAFLETALIQYAMEKAASRGFLAVLTPDIVRKSVAYGCGFQPRSGESSQIYDVKTNDEDTAKLCLAGTAEIPLAGKFATKVLNQVDLPQRVVGFGHAFRVEAGGRGVETKGLYRVHQFSKVELFAVTTAEQSESMLEEFRHLQEEMFTELGLCFRILDMPTEELGASAYRKYDMEAWMPGREKWGEISSTSNCTDYQSRRLSIRYRPTHHSGQNTLFCHTLNGTAMAVPRVIIAILETFQRPDGTVAVPKVLQKWMPQQISVLS
ncbi:seryl-tRNA synthetase [Radiomyces spectabilis]|uniref:seryl-tRNA synthetase n=1 Tax=Radiomyces spectabilis TaxID=64574 RepID=UPI00221F7E27|nr:seryl-tRNA synthetase [Radiomyces spectabilis]KAI8371549.1 seryl-tRNA synthetase [Radiomyces spectabilis]